MPLLTIAAGTAAEITVEDVRADFHWGDVSVARSPGPPRAIYLHHTADELPGGDAVDSVLQLATEATTAPYRIPYNFVVMPEDPFPIYYCNDLDHGYPHTYGHNADTAIAVAGNFEIRAPSVGLVSTLRQLVAALRTMWGRPDLPVYGHRDVYPTACPGQKLYDYLSVLQPGA